MTELLLLPIPEQMPGIQEQAFNLSAFNVSPNKEKETPDKMIGKQHKIGKAR